MRTFFGETAAVLFYSSVDDSEIDESIKYWTSKWSSFAKCTCTASTCIVMTRMQPIFFYDLILCVAKLRTIQPNLSADRRGHLMIFPEISDLRLPAQDISHLINTQFNHPAFVTGSFVPEFNVAVQVQNHDYLNPCRMTNAIIGSMNMINDPNVILN